jgi:hypothetical protein
MTLRKIVYQSNQAEPKTNKISRDQIIVGFWQRAQGENGEIQVFGEFLYETYTNKADMYIGPQ